MVISTSAKRGGQLLYISSFSELHKRNCPFW